MHILNILIELAATPSRNEKLSILRKHKDNKVLKKFFYLALDPLVTFGIKKIPQYETNWNESFLCFDNVMDKLERLITRDLTGNAAIDFLATQLSLLSPESAQVLERIIDKDPRCGVAAATVNAVWDNLIFEFPVMKAMPYDEKTIQNIKFPAYSQMKLDGARVQIAINQGVVTAFSSSGRAIEVHNQFDWLATISDNVVFDGELLVVDEFGKFMERKKGNGIVNRAVKGTIPVAQAKQLHFVVFDVIPIDDWKVGFWKQPYSFRFKSLVSYNTGDRLFRHNVSIVETKIVNTEREALKHFKELYTNGNEGTILKDADAPWENKRSKYQIKMKGIQTCDLRVVRVEEGTGKNKGKIGALVCQSSDGELEVNVGTGLTDADRALSFDFFVDKIVEIQYNERIVNKQEGSKWSLFLPRFVQVRNDKTEADNIELISIKGV